MIEPKRIQRKRERGWRMPADAVYVGRPSKWGNPWRAGKVRYLTGPKAGQVANRADVVDMFRNSITGKSDKAAGVRALARQELAGRDLVCWCKPGDPCHADVLLEVANGGDA